MSKVILGKSMRQEEYICTDNNHYRLTQSLPPQLVVVLDQSPVCVATFISIYVSIYAYQ